VLGAQHTEAMSVAIQDDLEIELNSLRSTLITAMLTALQTLEGYELFRELESIAASFKTLAYRYQENKWFRQALDCHRIHELVHIEMEYLPLKLQHYNWVTPDEIDLNIIWKVYTEKKPKASLKSSASRSGKVSNSRSVKLISIRGGVGAGDESDDDPQDDHSDDDDKGDEFTEADYRSIPSGTMAQPQFEMLLADCIFSGVQGRYLERIRRELGVKLASQMMDGEVPKTSGRLYKHLHALIDRSVAHFRSRLRGLKYVTFDQFKMFVRAANQDKISFVPSRSHILPDTGDAEARPYPSTVLFFHLDKFGKWNLGVDATNSFAAQQTLRILNKLHKTKQAGVFNEFYYE